MEHLAVDRDGPKSFILVPDGESSTVNPENDQIWALCLDASDTYPFYLHTTYQLRAKSLRLFPNISIDHQRLTEADIFIPLPRVIRYTPSTLQIKYGLLNHLNVQFTCFIPEADVLLGTLEIDNTGDKAVEVDCELRVILIPMGKGSPTHPEKIGANHILTGQVDDLFPVLFMSGSPAATSNPHPALLAQLHLEPGKPQVLHWAFVSKNSQTASLETARKLATSAWHKTAQIHIKKHTSQTIHIKTGEPDWDAAFTLAQVNAMTHLVKPDLDDTPPRFTRRRLPDQPARNQQDIDNLDDLTLLDTIHLAQVILPAHADHFSNLLTSFITRVNDQGCLPSRIHRSFSGGVINECPLLANLCLHLFEINEDQAQLRQAFPHLRRFFDAGWFKRAAPDPDAFPSWETPAQLQLDTGLFTFDFWEKTGRGLDIRTAESPALAAMLLREAFALQKIARILGDRPARSHYSKVIKVLTEKILSLWNDENRIFMYQDRQSQHPPTRELYYPGRLQDNIRINKRFSHPQRLQLHLITHDERTRACKVRVDGQSETGGTIVEVFTTLQIRWIEGHAHLTSQNLFAEINSVNFEGFNSEDRFIIETADYSQLDISCLLPLWSNHIHKDQLTSMLETHIDWQTPGFAFGIPETWRCNHPLPEGLPDQVNILWNSLIIDGLVRQGCIQEAMAAFTNLMSAIIHSLKDYNGFYPFFDITGGFPKGKANAITGLAPVELCLKIAGIKLFSPNRVAIWGRNPFPWPIEVHWQGLSVRREGTRTQITLPDGTYHQSQATKPQMVKSDRGQV